jgi:hypothetical protein
MSAIALLWLAAAYRYHFLYWNFDDTYIVFRIVRNLLSGHGWAFNAGEAHNASTSVLNTIVVALAAPLFSWNIPFAAHMLAGLWLSVAALAFGWIFWQRFDPWVALGAGAGLVVVLADNNLWGLETHLFFALLGVFAVLQHRRSSSWWAIGLLTLTRPDALILALLRWLRDVRLSPWPAGVAGWRESLRAPWVTNRRGLLVFALVLAPWVIFSLITFHQVFPDTLFNKMWQARSGFWGMGWVYLDALRSHLADFAPWRVTGYVLALPGLVFLIRDRSVLLYVVAFAAVQQAAYIFLNVPGYHWYFVSVDVAVVLAAFYGAGSIVEISFARHLRAARRYASIASYVAVLVSQPYGHGRSSVRTTLRMRARCRTRKLPRRSSPIAFRLVRLPSSKSARSATTCRITRSSISSGSRRPILSTSRARTTTGSSPSRRRSCCFTRHQCRHLRGQSSTTSGSE